MSMGIYFYKPVIFIVLFLACMLSLQAQPVIQIKDDIDQHIFSFQEIEYLEDPTDKLTIRDLSEGEYDSRFSPSQSFSPANENKNSTYWFKIRIKHNAQSRKQWVIEFFDQTIDFLELYIPDKNGNFTTHTLGDRYKFSNRPIIHKNFIVDLPNETNEVKTYFIKVKSDQRADLIVVLRSQSWLFQYALDEYFFFGIFYGMILVFSFYNLLMFLAVRESHYLLYVLYLVSIGLYEMSADGVAYQYLWPNSPVWNSYSPGFALYGASSLSLLFTLSLLSIKSQQPALFKVAVAALAFRTVFLILSLTLFKDWFSFKFIEVTLLATAFYIGVRCLRKGYRYARFIVVGYGFLFFGIISKISLYFNFPWLPFGPLSHYGLSFSFIMEMLFLSFAISDKIKMMLVDKHMAQEKTIEQLQINQQLKDNLNQELEAQVQIKTSQLVQKSEFIEKQNEQLAMANEQLAKQAEAIADMNAILERDNDQLKHDVAEVKEARVLSKEVDFEEFSSMYPDDESCLRFIATIKWQNGFWCKRCNHNNYSEGRSIYSRRCSRCGYDESVTAYTLLQNTRLPINKAFYMIFLVYSSNGSISSHKLSEILQIRQSTCWSYSSKIKKAMRDRHKSGKTDHTAGWDSILFE